MEATTGNDGVVDLEAVPEFRIYVSSQGGEPVAEIRGGEDILRQATDTIADLYPYDTIIVREVLETVIMVIKPRMTRV